MVRTHGRAGYNAGCRCDACVEANRAYGRVAKARYYGLSDQRCACGCGEFTGIAFGKPKRFVHLHHTRKPLAQILAERTMPEPNTGCLLWIGATGTWGYGVMTRKSLRVHRVVYAAAHGPIPEGMFVCHRCDTPACVNIDHLFLGTPQDNSDDKVRKGRAVFTPRVDRCVNGHVMTADNTYEYPLRPGQRVPNRACRRCRKDRHERRKKESAA